MFRNCKTAVVLGLCSFAVLARAADDPLYAPLDEALADGDSAGAAQLVNRLLGKKYLELGLQYADEENFRAAADAFNHALELDPGNHRAHLELGRANFALRDYDAARKEFQTVLDTDPPLPVLKNIKRYLDEMDQRPASTWTWDVQYAAGVTYDDNVNIGPAASDVRIAPVSLAGSTFDTLIVDPASEPAEAWGAFGYVSVLAENDVGERDGWRSIGGASYYRNVLSDETDFELQYASGLAGLRHITRRNFVELPIRVEHLERGGDVLVDVIGVRPGWVHAADQNLYWVGQSALEWRDYDEFDDLDAFYAEVRGNALRYFGRDRNNATAGVAVFREDADNDEFSNTGFELTTTAQRMLPWKLTLVPRLRYRWEDYDEREPLAPEDREDHEFMAGLELKRKINAKLDAVLSDQYTDNHSTFDLYDYDRNVVSLSLQGRL